MGFLLGGASSSDEESSLLDLAAAAAAAFTGVGLAGAGLAGAYQDKWSKYSVYTCTFSIWLSFSNLWNKDDQKRVITFWYGQILLHTLAGSSSSEELSSLLLSCFFWAAPLAGTAGLDAVTAPALGSIIQR